MLTTYATGLAVAAGLTVAWIAVQGAWRRTVADHRHDADALAGRVGCHGCARPGACPEGGTAGACRREETR